MAYKITYLHTEGTRIVDERGKRIVLKGVNLGGWLMMEGYMFGGRNISEHELRASVGKELGKEALTEFTRAFRDTFIREDDIKIIKSWGANCIRIPFNYRLIECEEGARGVNREGLSYLDRAVKWCEKHNIYCILDMHAAPGAQNCAWHSDSYGKAALFTSEANKSRYVRLWRFLADRYQGSAAVAGYDVLNEPVVGLREEGELKELYGRVVQAIRSADKKHIIFLEGNILAQRINFLGKPADHNTVYSMHAYPSLDFTHNFEIGLQYPGTAHGIRWDRDSLERLAATFTSFMNKHQVPLYVGEFGVNARGGHAGEVRWVEDIISIFTENHLSWTYWTYKTIANYAFPDGIYRYLANPAWVNRQGPVSGCETFAGLWPTAKSKMTRSWRTENFVRNDTIYAVLRKYFLRVL
ncbi:MAG: glycoside hydrolase family 5 protein [Candidatus Omnitrophota bacterium]